MFKTNEPVIADAEMEKFILSAMLRTDASKCISTARAILDAEDFYYPRHRIIYRTILKIYDGGENPNILTLLDELRKSNTMDAVGTEFAYFLTEYAHTTAYVESYAKEVKEKAKLRLVKFAAEKIISDVEKGNKPVAEILDAFSAEAAEITKSTDETKIISLHDFVGKEFDNVMKRKAAYAQRKSGFTNLDKAQIWTPGIFCIGGTPGSGKTTFCTQLLENFARKGEDCIYCSYEMSAEEIVLKSIARQLYLDNPYTRLYASNIHENYKEDDRRQSTANNFSKIIDARAAVDKIDELKNFRVIELHGENTDKLLNLINQCCKSDKPPVVCIDYLQLLAQVDGTENVKVAVDNTVRKLKTFQRDTGSTIFAVSSLNRGNYAEIAGFEAFKESGGIDYGFDVAWILQPFIVNNLGGKDVSEKRKMLAEAMKERPRKIQLKCLKNRRGTLYDCFFNYYAQHDYFVEPTDDVNANPNDRCWYEETDDDSSSSTDSSSIHCDDSDDDDDDYEVDVPL